MIGIGQLLGAEFLAATGGNMKAWPDHLAGYAGLAPAPRDSGRHRQPAPRRIRNLMHVGGLRRRVTFSSLRPQGIRVTLCHSHNFRQAREMTSRG
jgi:hypothetical protein